MANRLMTAIRAAFGMPTSQEHPAEYERVTRRLEEQELRLKALDERAEAEVASDRRIRRLRRRATDR